MRPGRRRPEPPSPRREAVAFGRDDGSRGPLLGEADRLGEPSPTQQHPGEEAVEDAGHAGHLAADPLTQNARSGGMDRCDLPGAHARGQDPSVQAGLLKVMQGLLGGDRPVDHDRSEPASSTAASNRALATIVDLDQVRQGAEHSAQPGEAFHAREPACRRPRPAAPRRGPKVHASGPRQCGPATRSRPGSPPPPVRAPLTRARRRQPLVISLERSDGGRELVQSPGVLDTHALEARKALGELRDRLPLSGQPGQGPVVVLASGPGARSNL